MFTNPQKSSITGFQILADYKEIIESKILSEIPKMGIKDTLRDCIEYALTNGGKRFRPILVLMVAKALGHYQDISDISYAALAVEYSHTASLIADDLPSMDNDDMRRNKPSVHKVFGESVALLASYALLSAGYECLATNARIIVNSKLPFASRGHEICCIALENITYNAGILRLIGGQYLDIFPPSTTPEMMREIMVKKTVSLCEIAFVLGWLYGGGSFGQLPLVKRAAEHFGLAFQIADDFGDIEQDRKNQRSINAALILGVDAAKKMFHEEINSYRKTVKELGLDPAELLVVADLLENRATQRLNKYISMN